MVNEPAMEGLQKERELLRSPNGFVGVENHHAVFVVGEFGPVLWEVLRFYKRSGRGLLGKRHEVFKRLNTFFVEKEPFHTQCKRRWKKNKSQYRQCFDSKNHFAWPIREQSVINLTQFGSRCDKNVKAWNAQKPSAREYLLIQVIDSIFFYQNGLHCVCTTWPEYALVDHKESVERKVTCVAALWTARALSNPKTTRNRESRRTVARKKIFFVLP